MVIASPADFIGQYLGFTSQKTRTFLKSSLGKVVFVDEAYGFIPRKDHMYGREALNEITSFIDANHGKIVLIFAGYEDKLRQDVQKGMDRRFGMHITCTGYSHAELFQMLNNKLATRGMTLTDDNRCFEEFRKGEFTYFAGDIDILSDYLREPLAEAYVVNKANSSCGEKTTRAERSTRDCSVGDDSMELSSEMSRMDSQSVSSNEGESTSDEGYGVADCGVADWKVLLRNSLKVSPQIMKDTVTKLNARRNKSSNGRCADSDSDPDFNTLVKQLFNRI